MRVKNHGFFAVAFEDAFSPRDLGVLFPSAKGQPHERRVPLGEGEIFAFAFGALVFRDVPRDGRDAELKRLSGLRPTLTKRIDCEELVVREEPGAVSALDAGVLVVDQLTPARAGIVALTVAQSAAMEYFERLVEDLFARTRDVVAQLERRGTMSLRTRRLHRFIGEAVSTRTYVISILHLLDKPDATWDDPAMDRIYDDLRDEFDLGDRYEALEAKLRSVQEALSLVLDVARDRRLVLLEAAIVVLIVIEIGLSLMQLK